jgi:DNA-binding LacI/PurR family transcriptional regulator
MSTFLEVREGSEAKLVPRHEVSISDIARQAGVSHTTVSRALRNSTLISIDVREQIQRLAREMGYTPNGIAQSLQTRRTNTIGLVVTSIADPFLNDVVKGVEEVARGANLSIFLSATHNDPDLEMTVIEMFHRRRVDGILVASSRITNEYKKRIDQIRVPTVFINSQAEAQDSILHWVAVDDRLGAQTAVEHLLQLGHRSVGYVGISSRPRSNRHRLQGYWDALAAVGIAYRESLVTISSGSEASDEEDVAAGQASLAHFLNERATAVFCYNDMVAIGLLRACHEHGVAVPQELSVVGFDDIAMANYVTPALTTIRQPKVELGRLATRVMLELLEDQSSENHVLLPELIERASTAALVTV